MSSNQKNTTANTDIQSGRDVQIGDRTYHNTYLHGQTVTIPHLLTNHIPVNVSHILGRAAELAATKAHLVNNQTTVLVNGIGGIGKTSVAAKFMVVYGSEYTHRAWVTVQSSLSDAFINNTTLLDALHIAARVEELVSAQQTRAAFDCVMHQLNLLDKTLVVIDNANDLADLLEYKELFDSAQCHFLITSRSRPQEWTVVPIEHLPAQEAVDVLKKLAPSVFMGPIDGVMPNHPVNNADKTIENLLSKLYFHTLLIELVAKAVTSAGLSFDELANMIHTRFIHHETLREEIVATGKHGDSLPENIKRANIEDYIWHIFQEVKGLDDKSKDILRGFALLPLGQAFDREALKKHFAVLGIEDIVRTLTVLTERGWLDKEQTAGQRPQYKMHPLIADVVMKHLGVTVGFAEGYIEYVADLICYDDTNIQHNLFGINKNKPFGDRLSDLFYNERTKSMSKLLDNLSGLEAEFGFYQKAVIMKEHALDIAKIIFGQNHKIVAIRQSNLALIYRLLGRYSEAAVLLETALASDLKNFDKEDTEVATKQSNLANVYSDLGRYTEAVDLLEIALTSDLKNFDKGHPCVAGRQSNLANVYKILDRYEEAAELLEKALTSDLKNFGKEHPTVATNQSNLALVYKALGRYDEAAILLKKAMTSDVRNFGQEHPTVAINQSNLANVYIDLSRYEEATVLLEKSIANAEKNFGKEHPTVAIRQNNLAWLYNDVGRKAEAKVLWQAAYQNYLKNLGATHPHTIKFKEFAERE